jgi:hypothetical protein
MLSAIHPGLRDAHVRGASEMVPPENPHHDCFGKDRRGMGLAASVPRAR